MPPLQFNRALLAFFLNPQGFRRAHLLITHHSVQRIPVVAGVKGRQSSRRILSGLVRGRKFNVPLAMFPTNSE